MDEDLNGIEEDIMNRYYKRKAYTEVRRKTGYKPHTSICRGKDVEIKRKKRQ